jgi:2-polyprenyl-6-methoxyphenol hydroxylase-like FAD-dependent oxidoreductase
VKRLEVAICGCGPGGLATALLLERCGHRVRLLERFDAPRPLGSGLLLQTTGLAVLDELGLGQRMRALGQPIRRLYGRAVPSGRIALDVRFAALGPGVTALAVHRGALFTVLYDAVVARGIEVVTGCEAVGIERDADGRPAVRIADGRRLGAFDLVVDASGARSQIAASATGRRLFRPLAYGALWATVPWPAGAFAEHDLEQRYRRADVMIGILPVGRRSEGAPAEGTLFWSLKPTEYRAWRQRGIAAWRDEVQALWPQTSALLASIDDPDQLVLASYGHHTLRPPHAERLAFVGDIAHATSPQLGQGANMALLDALALATALERAPDVARGLADYARTRAGHVRLYQSVSRLFTPFYQSDSRVLPVLRDLLFAPVASLPGAQRLLASLVAGQWASPLGRIGPERALRNSHGGAAPNAPDQPEKLPP